MTTAPAICELQVQDKGKEALIGFLYDPLGDKVFALRTGERFVLPDAAGEEPWVSDELPPGKAEPPKQEPLPPAEPAKPPKGAADPANAARPAPAE